jgi:hypothetical protein
MPQSPAVKRWLRDQGSMDVRGIDTPNKSRKAKQQAQKRRERKTEKSIRIAR